MGPVQVHGAFDYISYLNEADFTIQKGLDCNLVGGVHYGRHALAVVDGPVRQPQTAEFVQIRFEEGQAREVCQIQGLDSGCDPLRIGEGVGNGRLQESVQGSLYEA